MVLVNVIQAGIQVVTRISQFGRVGKYAKAYGKYDRSLHTRAFGRSGGRGKPAPSAPALCIMVIS